jgi:hypothetical protein
LPRGTVLPISGFSDPTLGSSAPFMTRAIDVLRHLILPAGTLALLISATVSRYQRAALIDVLPNNWMRTARAKGVRRGGLLFKHALRNALLPTITLLGLAVPALVGGAVFVEVRRVAGHGIAGGELSATRLSAVLAIVLCPDTRHPGAVVMTRSCRHRSPLTACLTAPWLLWPRRRGARPFGCGRRDG